MHLYKLLDYGTEELPLAVWQVKFDAGNLQFRKNDEHRHDCMEVMFVTRGSGVCRINGAAYPVLRGDLYIITPEDVHSYLLDPECEFYNILFEPEFFATVPELAAIIAKWRKNREHPQVVFLSPDKIDHLTTLAERMTDELHSRRRGAQWLARCLFGEFMVELIRQQELAQITAPPPGQPQTASRILTYIERHLHGELSLRQLARLAGMSDSTFSAAFRKWTGSSAFEYIAALKIRRACSLLKEPKLSIGEIARQLGFSDSCHFSRAFRRRTGMAPREYRRHLKEHAALPAIRRGNGVPTGRVETINPA